LACVRGTSAVTDADYLTVYRVAVATIPAQRRTMLRVLLTDTAPAVPTAQIAEHSGYPTDTARRYLQELAAMQLIDRTVSGPGKADLWTTSELSNRYLVAACPAGGGGSPVSPLDI